MKVRKLKQGMERCKFVAGGVFLRPPGRGFGGLPPINWEGGGSGGKFGILKGLKVSFSLMTALSLSVCLLSQWRLMLTCNSNS